MSWPTAYRRGQTSARYAGSPGQSATTVKGNRRPPDLPSPRRQTAPAGDDYGGRYQRPEGISDELWQSLKDTLLAYARVTGGPLPPATALPPGLGDPPRKGSPGTRPSGVSPSRRPTGTPGGSKPTRVGGGPHPSMVKSPFTNPYTTKPGPGLPGIPGGNRFWWPFVIGGAVYEIWDNWQPAMRPPLMHGWRYTQQCGKGGIPFEGGPLSGCWHTGAIWTDNPGFDVDWGRATIVQFLQRHDSSPVGLWEMKYHSLGATIVRDLPSGNASAVPETEPQPTMVPADSSGPDPLAPYRDPFLYPPGGWKPDPVPTPWKAIPFWEPNEDRAPSERSDRGDTPPLPPGDRPAGDDVDAPGPGPRPGPMAPRTVPRDQPGREHGPWPEQGFPGPRDMPRPRRPELPEEDVPGWVAQPPAPGAGTRLTVGTTVGLVPDTGTGTPPAIGPVTGNRPGTGGGSTPSVPSPIRVERPSGSAGPTITVGGGPPIGAHRLRPPGKREKERKAKWVKAGLTVIRHGVDPVTEALDVLDCFWKALPKGIRWDVTRRDWDRQRKSGAVPRPKDPLEIKPPQVSIGIGDITLPGAVNTRTQYAELGANYIQPPSPQLKAGTVYEHADKLDLASVVKCLITDQIEDFVIGKHSQILAKAWSKHFPGRLRGIETGPVF